jgi:low affinity Fe/Cu permease
MRAVLVEKKRAQARSHTEWFSVFSQGASRFTGKPMTFIVAVLAVIAWAATGPLFNYSDTWQLVINTSTTIITFLMVFLIQNTQNRESLAVQAKLAELIIAVQGAKNKMATAEDLSEDDLEKLHQDYCARAEATLETLQHRRTQSAT